MRSTPTLDLPDAASDAAHRCSVLGTLRLVGDFWTLGIVRCAVYGMRRFSEFEEELGIATNVLSNRLTRLVEAEILDRVAYQQRPTRHEYVLTDAGWELATVVLALKEWGDRHVQPDGAWTEIQHVGCDGSTRRVEARPVCTGCGQVVAIAATEVHRLR